jgi:maltose O-acetyltransferase
MLLELFHDLGSRAKERAAQYMLERRWRKYREHGMHLGKDVLLPASTWIDVGHCHLISIGDHCGFGADCLILAHDAQMDEFLDAARLGCVTIHESCHIGARTVILPGVEIGPRTLVGANSVISRSLPPESVCAGNPARVICSLSQYLDKHRAKIASAAKFEYLTYGVNPSGQQMDEMRIATNAGPAYMVGGRTAELRGEGKTPRTD